MLIAASAAYFSVIYPVGADVNGPNLTEKNPKKCKCHDALIMTLQVSLPSPALTFTTTLLTAQTLPSCPGGNADPTKFCPVGQQWSDAAQDCIVMA